MSNLTLQLGSSSAYGCSCNGMFTVASPSEFTWEDGRVFAEAHLDDAIYRYNLLLQARAKKLGSTSGLHYQYIRNGPIKAVLKGPCQEPKHFPPTRWHTNEWFCHYRYPAKQGTSAKYLASKWWNTPPKKGTPVKVDMMGDQDEPLY